MTIFISNFLSSILSYIFQFPKPYMAFYKVKSVVFFNEWGSPNNQIVLLKCCSEYPAPWADMHLGNIPDMAERFGLRARTMNVLRIKSEA